MLSLWIGTRALNAKLESPSSSTLPWLSLELNAAELLADIIKYRWRRCWDESWPRTWPARTARARDRSLSTVDEDVGASASCTDERDDPGVVDSRASSAPGARDPRLKRLDRVGSRNGRRSIEPARSELLLPLPLLAKAPATEMAARVRAPPLIDRW
jgi:hypothetical protein